MYSVHQRRGKPSFFLSVPVTSSVPRIPASSSTTSVCPFYNLLMNVPSAVFELHHEYDVINTVLIAADDRESCIFRTGIYLENKLLGLGIICCPVLEFDDERKHLVDNGAVSVKKLSCPFLRYRHQRFLMLIEYEYHIPPCLPPVPSLRRGTGWKAARPL